MFKLKNNFLTFALTFFSLSLFTAGIALGSYADAKNHFEKYGTSTNNEDLFIKMVEAKLYYSAVPLIKSIFMQTRGKLNSRTEEALSTLILVVGVKQFETLPDDFFLRTNSGTLKYVMAKKAFRDGNNSKALGYLNGINRRHPIFTFAKNLEGTIYAIEEKLDKAYDSFDICEENSNIKSLSERRVERIKLNRDYCIIGKARVRYAQKNFDKSDLLYLDIPKSSAIWPEVLFEEAWNSYYQGNFNRSLGKLVSYKAPVFSYFFNPEVDVLRALSFLKLCLYSDAKKTVVDFNRQYFSDTKKFRKMMEDLGKNYSKYFSLIYRYEQFGKAPTQLMRNLFDNINKEQVYKELRYQLVSTIREIDRAKANRQNSFTKYLLGNLAETARSYQKITGFYIRSKLVSFYAQLYKAFEGMSYIKLEVLAQKKAKLYSFSEENRNRGDLKYVERNEKQYFWDFNGEFWADELGDYVFALKSEC